MKNWLPSSSYSFVPFTEICDMPSTRLAAMRSVRHHARMWRHIAVPECPDIASEGEPAKTRPSFHLYNQRWLDWATIQIQKRLI